MGSAPISTDKSPEQMALQITSFIVHILISLAVYLAIFLVLTIVNPTDIPAILVTLLSFVLPLAVAYMIHISGRRTAAPAIWIAGVVWLLMVMVYVLELPTGPGRCGRRPRRASVVIVGIRASTAARRIAFSSKNVSCPRGVLTIS
jgi:hypothetical protein